MFGIGFLGVVLVVAFVGVGVGAIVLTHRRAESAADLAALAAATGYQQGLSPCAQARRVATANDATLVSCAMDGPVATVSVECAAVIGHAFRMTGRARAGPAPAGSQSPRTRRLRRVTAPDLSSGWFWLPHLGDWTQEGQPLSQGHSRMRSRVARSHSSAHS